MNPLAKPILITGAARRIGAALSRHLAKQSFPIAIHYHGSKDEAEALRKDIIADGGKAEIFQADLSKFDDVQKLPALVAEAMGPLYGLINNASLFLEDKLETLTLDQWDEQFAVNLRAPVFLAHKFAKLVTPGQAGIIINLIDQKILKLNPSFYSYTITKSALWTATQTMAQSLAPDIRVNAIGPGPVLKSIHQTDEIFTKECREKTLLGRGASLEDLSLAVDFILQNKALTGAFIPVDGGQHLKS